MARKPDFFNYQMSLYEVGEGGRGVQGVQGWGRGEGERQVYEGCEDSRWLRPDDV